MRTALEPAIEPDLISPPEGRGSLLPEIEEVLALRKGGRNAFEIAGVLRRPLRWVLDRICLAQIDREVLAMVTPEAASELRRRYLDEYGPVLEMGPVRPPMAANW